MRTRARRVRACHIWKGRLVSLEMRLVLPLVCYLLITCFVALRVRHESVSPCCIPSFLFLANMWMCICPFVFSSNEMNHWSEASLVQNKKVRWCWYVLFAQAKEGFVYSQFLFVTNGQESLIQASKIGRLPANAIMWLFSFANRRLSSPSSYSGLIASMTRSGCFVLAYHRPHNRSR